MAYFHVMEKPSYLIIHPGNDPTTFFLQRLYKGLPNKTVITGEITKKELQEHLSTQPYSTVIMCGHGSTQGLLSGGQFPKTGLYIIDDTMVSSLRNKAHTLFIWCNADVFVHRNELTGFRCAMFLSQMSECLYFDVDCTEEDIIESNTAFAETVAQHINEPPILFYKKVLTDYGRLMKNPVARYNHCRLFFNRYTPDLVLDKVVQTQCK